ncbi:MAG: CsgG/HfaB family protein [Thalassobaculaceae bacterium]|nr:CsgG/HfaB family protein [Thalassobaculaceae bacterium]
MTIATPLAAAARMVATLALGLILVGCASGDRQARDYLDPTADFTKMKVAVLPFENLTNYPNAGRIAAELMATELYERGIFQLQESTETRQTLAQMKIDPENLTSVAAAQQAAGLLEVDAIVVGTVSEFGYQQGLREEPVVGLNARLVEAATGNVLWASSHSALGGGYLERGSLNATAQRVISAMVAPLTQR